MLHGALVITYLEAQISHKFCSLVLYPNTCELSTFFNRVSRNGYLFILKYYYTLMGSNFVFDISYISKTKYMCRLYNCTMCNLATIKKNFTIKIILITLKDKIYYYITYAYYKVIKNKNVIPSNCIQQKLNKGTKPDIILLSTKQKTLTPLQYIMNPITVIDVWISSCLVGISNNLVVSDFSSLLFEDKPLLFSMISSLLSLVPVFGNSLIFSESPTA
ncbi:hypothetical protein AGLY_014479 [Aphis glycines]|uniref:Uncharacterized protein n=1 Tax=Aphis glycines TaxID=307491 RepID=A0A6G0T3Z9_APHGL|nr:hypothetical protein AGLY_014479 [Aphis glycines]